MKPSIVEVYYHLWSKPNGLTEVRVLLDDDKRISDRTNLYCLSAGNVRLFFYHIGEKRDEISIAHMALKVWETHYPDSDARQVYFSRVLTEGNVQ